MLWTDQFIISINTHSQNVKLEESNTVQMLVICVVFPWVNM